MIESLAVFLCQLTYVFLLGFQSRNVRDGQMISAAITSTILGAGGLFMTSAIARSAMLGGNNWLALSYIAAGPCGICLAMIFHDKLSGIDAENVRKLMRLAIDENDTICGQAKAVLNAALRKIDIATPRTKKNKYAKYSKAPTSTDVSPEIFKTNIRLP